MFSKSEVMRLFLCDARLRLSREHRLFADFAETKQSKALVEGLRRQKRSIVEPCEHFGVRRTRAKRTHQNDFSILGGCVDGFDYLVRVSAASPD